MTPAERDAARLEARRRGEPTLPLSSELAGLSDAEAADVIAAAATIAAAWWRRRPVQPARASRSRRKLLAKRVRAEVLADPASPLPRARRGPARGPGCPWCGRACAPFSPACIEHDELERGFLQAAGDGWG